MTELQPEPMPRPVDLRSDTVTRPTDGMRRAMATAGVGDDVLDGDPTVERLEREVAGLLGKPGALFFPTGTMANQAGILLHSRPGSEVVCEEEAHVFHYEMADVAFLSGAQLRTVPSDRGVPSPEAYEDAIRGVDRYHPHTSLLCLENTHNLHGGTVVPLERAREIRDLADRHDLPVHLDGARLWNAHVATGVDLSDFAACADTVMVTLSKGLGCPAGSLLAGSREDVRRAWRIRKRLGGGMRQVGILAGAGLYALEFHLEELGADHERARRLARRADAVDGLAADEPESNIVMIRVERDGMDAGAVSETLEAWDVRILDVDDRRLRAVTHRDVDDGGIDRAVEALRAVMAGAGSRGGGNPGEERR